MKVSKIIKNKVITSASWIIICRIIQSVGSLLVMMIISRHFGPSGFGLINYASSVCTFFLPFMQLGLHNIQVNEILNNQDKEHGILGTSILLSFVSSLFCIVGVVLFVLVANRGETETIIVCAIYSLILLFQGIEIIQYWFQAHYKFKYVSIIVLTAFFISSIIKLLLVLNGRPIRDFAVSYVFEHFIIALLLYILYRKQGGMKPYSNKAIAKELLNKSKYYIIANLMLVIFAQTDKVMLKLMLSNEATGIYSAAFALSGMLNFIYDAVIDAFRPSIIQKKNEDSERYIDCLQNLNCIIVFLCVIMGIGITIFARMAIMIIYGNEYLASVPVTRIVVWYTVFAYLGTVRNIWLLIENKQNYLWKVNMFGALINVVLNITFIPVMGAEGAAIATLVTQFFTNVVLSYVFKAFRPYSRILIHSLNPMRIIHMIKEL